ncbi:MAG: cobyrinate a,c-diamide synthase [Acidobacteriota bacterium]
MSQLRPLPRLVVAGLSGEAGKTVVSLALVLAARRRGLPVAAFKKGPDYIDAAWLAWASDRPARNLDTFLMGFERAVASFARHAAPAGLSVIEGNRGLYDGADVRGADSTAELAKALAAPVILVLNATKVTRTAAACVLGCQKLDAGVPIAGVILNQVARPRHEKLMREAVESECGLPVVGVIPRAPAGALLPGRHLGLVPPEEHPFMYQMACHLRELADGLDLDKLLALAASAPPLPAPLEPRPASADGSGLKVGYLRDSAFTFYYPENLEALEAAGASLVPVSALFSQALPEDLDALYIGGGFPETHAAALAANTALLTSLRRNAEAGLPVYAECGGLMLLARAIRWQGRTYPMAGVLPFEVEVCASPQGHGYTVLAVDRPNPFFPVGVTLKGHEFHYSRIVADGAAPACAGAVLRGAGCWKGRDGVIQGNVWAGYTHLHALATPEWAAGLLKAARLIIRQETIS